MGRLETVGWARKAMEDIFTRFDGRSSARLLAAANHEELSFEILMSSNNRGSLGNRDRDLTD